jgi:hypothetical protein
MQRYQSNLENFIQILISGTGILTIDILIVNNLAIWV